jgi:hypothetical protein
MIESSLPFCLLPLSKYPPKHYTHTTRTVQLVELCLDINSSIDQLCVLKQVELRLQHIFMGITSLVLEKLEKRQHEVLVEERGKFIGQVINAVTEDGRRFLGR